MPPTGKIYQELCNRAGCHSIYYTFPVREISPVMAKCCLTGLFMASDSNADVNVQPADGPSFGVAPYSEHGHAILYIIILYYIRL